MATPKLEIKNTPRNAKILHPRITSSVGLLFGPFAKKAGHRLVRFPNPLADGQVGTLSSHRLRQSGLAGSSHKSGHIVTLLLINTKGVDNNKGMGNTDVVGEIKEVNNTKMVDKAKVRKLTIVGGVGGDHCGRLTTPW